MRMQDNDVPLPMLVDFHGWTENSMGHENDGHNFFQVDFFGGWEGGGGFFSLRMVKDKTNKRPEKNYASHLHRLKLTWSSLCTRWNQEASAKVLFLLIYRFLDRNVQENNIPLPLLLDFHGWTGNAMGHESDGHNFYQVRLVFTPSNCSKRENEDTKTVNDENMYIFRLPTKTQTEVFFCSLQKEQGL